MKTNQKPVSDRRRRGFQRASGLLGKQIRSVSESRGFAVSRLLTHWSDIVGSETAKIALPVKISYGQGGFGATLTILTTGANAPMLQAEIPKINDAVNRCYGYAAISRIRITQTAATGFAEGQAVFMRPKEKVPSVPGPHVVDRAKRATGAVSDDGLRAALEKLGTNIISSKDSQR